MKRRDFLGSLLAAATATPVFAFEDEAAADALVPRADHHQHLFSPAMARLLDTGSGGPGTIAGTDLIALLDAAGIRRAALLSVAYVYGSPSRTIEDEYKKVMAENDFNGAQASLYPERLRALGSFNPLKEYALDELARCAAAPHLKHGIKLHFGNSDVQLELPEHVARLQKVFAAANKEKMAIVLHLRASVTKSRPYGAAQARIFLDELLPAAPDVTVQVAHMAGTGPGYDDAPADEAMGVLAEALAAKAANTRRLWIDVATVANGELSPASAAKLVRRIRQVGVDRILFGSDAAAGKNLRPRDSWAAFRKLALTDDEFRHIARNLAPYFT